MKWISGRTAYEKAKKRVEKLDSVSILDWCDAGGSGVAKALQDYRRHRDSDALQEARVGLETLLACVEEIQARHFE